MSGVANRLVLTTSATSPARFELRQYMTAFFALMRSGELAWPDKIALQNERKISPRHSVRVTDTAYEFLLPGHKGDRFFEGSRIVVQKLDALEDPWAPFVAYLDSRDWLRSDGTIPKYSWFTTRLKSYFADSDRNIQAAGRWSSEAFRI